MKFEALTIVAAFGDSGVSLHVDEQQLEQLGLTKSLHAYAAIKMHCEGVINAVIEDIGEEALLQVMAEIEQKGQMEAIN